jgi:hypothetical protein
MDILLHGISLLPVTFSDKLISRVDLLTQIGYNNGVPIDEEFFINNIAGRSDVEAAQNLFPDWELEKGLKFLDDKEEKYRR